MNPWTERNQARQDAAKAWGIVSKKNQTIDDLERQLASANSLVAKLMDRLGESDCWPRCFVNYAGKNYDDVCNVHFDRIGHEIEASRGR